MPQAAALPRVSQVTFWDTDVSLLPWLGEEALLTQLKQPETLCFCLSRPYIIFYVFIWLCLVLVVACRIFSLHCSMPGL